MTNFSIYSLPNNFYYMLENKGVNLQRNAWSIWSDTGGQFETFLGGQYQRFFQPSVQLDLVTWLFNEMSHLERKKNLGIVAPVEFKAKENPGLEKGIYSQFTIEEMGLLLHALQETELVRNKNMKQAAQSMAEHWHSKQKENISWQYLYNSMSTVEMGTIKSLEDKLITMVNWLRKMRGRNEN